MGAFTERRDPRPALAIGLTITAVVALLDFLTPADVDFGEFYMLAVILTAWSVGLRAGLLFALLGACAVLAVDTALRGPTQPTEFAIALWNWVSDFLVLSALAFVTDRAYQERHRWMRIDARAGASARKAPTRSRPSLRISARSWEGTVIPRVAANASAISSALNNPSACW